MALLWASSTSTHIILAVGSDRGSTLVRRSVRSLEGSYCGSIAYCNLEGAMELSIFQISESKLRMQKLDSKEVKVHILVF